ncbi:EAL domain-containing protein [Pseudoalteromonas sp. SSDWG2]|uniref:EAL domain-containing protein n=1 Tax=Pseudoalteromonas sp. SSDWG2 TaxID=3139391 RepID=UPI003BAD8712
MTNLASYAGDNISEHRDVVVNERFAVLDEPTLLAKVLSQSDALFQSGSWAQVPWRFSTEEYWLSIELTNTREQNKELVARFDNPMLDKLTVYHLDSQQQLLESLSLGDHRLGLSSLQYALPHYAFTLPANETQYLLVAINTSGISKTPITIHEREKFEHLTLSAFSLWSVYVGVLLMTAVYNLILYFSIRDRVYLVYVAYILSVMTLLGTVLGYGFYLWPVDWQLYFHHKVIISNFAIAITTLGFCIMFLRYYKDKQRPYTIAIRYLQLLIVLCIISAWLPEYYSAPLFFLTMPGLYIICLWLIYKKLVSGFRWAKFYIISWLPLVCSAAVQPLELTGVLEYNYLTRHAFLFGSLIEIALMALALADRVRYQRKKALYHATHNSHSGLLNYTTLSQQVESLQSSGIPFCLCVIYMNTYQGLQKILSVEQSNNLLRNVAQNINQNLLHMNCLPIVHHSDEKVVELNGGCLAFMLDTQNRTNMHDALSQMIMSLDKAFDIETLTLQSDYHIAVIESTTLHGNVKQRIEYACHTLQRKSAQLQSVIYLDNEETGNSNQLALAAKLQKAISHSQLRIYYQPQVDLDTLQVSGAEALLRWPGVQNKDFTVEDIIKLAEQVGLINDLTMWVINTVCHDIAEQNGAWHAHCVSINISARDIHIDDFADKLAYILKSNHIEPHQIKLELTESALVDDIQALKTLISELAQLGVLVVLDDYGTGYSSLEYVLEYAFCELKIDKHFVISMASSEHHQAIVRTTINMAHNLGLQVTAEGVETQEVAALLREYRAEKGQGYLFAKPMPIGEYVQWLSEHRNQH